MRRVKQIFIIGLLLTGLVNNAIGAETCQIKLECGTLKPLSFEIIDRWEFSLKLPGGTGPNYIYGGGWHKTPVSGQKIIKHFDDTVFWVMWFGDVIAHPQNTVPDNYFTGVWIDGQNMASVSLMGSPGKNITHVINNFVQHAYPKGEHMFDIMVATSGNTRGIWQFEQASELRVFEVRLPKISRPTR